MLQLHGNTRSRALRCLWMLEEIGQPYELIEKSPAQVQGLVTGHPVGGELEYVDGGTLAHALAGRTNVSQ